MPGSTTKIDYRKRAIYLVAVVFILRLLYAASFAINPVGDEAYYWDWSRQPDYGYYSKPPLIAWLYAIVDWLGQGSLFSIRATAASLGAVGMMVFFKMTESMFDARTGWFAVLLSAAIPAISVLSFFLTIDAPLMMCWAIALWMLWRYVSEKGGGGSLAILFIALTAGHLSKQMMMVFPPLALIFLAGHRDTRPLLRRPALWCVLLGSYLALIPPLVWNARHDWITFKHTAQHFEVNSEAGSIFLQRLVHFFEFVGSQFGVISPLVASALFSACFVGMAKYGKTPKPVRYLLTFSAVPLAFIMILALRQELEPNWPGVFYIAGIALTAGWYNSQVQLPFPPPSWRRYFPWSIIVGGLMSLAFYLAPICFKAIGKSGHPLDPNRRLLGHDVVAAKVELLRRTIQDADELFLVAAGHRDLASFLAFRLPDQPRVYLWDSDGRITSQYEIWNNPLEDGYAGKDGLIICPNSSDIPEGLSRAFNEVEKVGEFEVRFTYEATRRFSVFHGRALGLWPRDLPAEDP